MHHIRKAIIETAAWLVALSWAIERVWKGEDLECGV